MCDTGRSKWIFATLAFVSGSVVAQLLQPAAAKTGGLEEGVFVARVEAATAFEAAPAALRDSSEPLAHSQDQRSPAQVQVTRPVVETSSAATTQSETASKTQPVPVRPSQPSVRQTAIVSLSPLAPPTEPTPLAFPFP